MIMAVHVRHSHRERAVFAVRHPRMLSRKLRSRDMTAISPAEIAPYLPACPVILEAGACDGTDTARFAAQWPGAVIHAFEPVPSLYAEAARRTAGLPGVRLHPLALSDRCGWAVMHAADPGRGANRGTSSLLAHAQPPPGVADVRVETVTIADWAAAQGVRRIDLMWLDMEGGELAALRAAGPVLATAAAVCMEVSREERHAGAPLYGEVAAWMRDQGFRAAIDRVSLWFGNMLFTRVTGRSR
jgi:FkbM family methyltransferase